MSFLSKVKDFFESFSPSTSTKPSSNTQDITNDDTILTLEDVPPEEPAQSVSEPQDVQVEPKTETLEEEEPVPVEVHNEEKSEEPTVVVSKPLESEKHEPFVPNPEAIPEPPVQAAPEPSEPTKPEKEETPAEAPAEVKEKPKAERVLTEKECKALANRAHKIAMKLEHALMDYNVEHEIYWPSVYLVGAEQILECVILRVQLGRDYPKAKKNLRAVTELILNEEHLDERMADSSVALATNAPELWRYLWDLILSQPAAKDWDIYMEMLRDFVNLFDDETLDHRLVEFIADPPAIPVTKPFQSKDGLDKYAILAAEFYPEPDAHMDDVPATASDTPTPPEPEPIKEEPPAEEAPAEEAPRVEGTKPDIEAGNEPEAVSEEALTQEPTPEENPVQNAPEAAESASEEDVREAMTAAMPMKPSIVFTDPKGELYEKLAETFAAHGYEIRTLSLKDMDEVGFWNIFSAISDDKVEQSVDIIVNTLMANFQEGGEKVEDNIYINGEKLLLKALILRVYLGMDYPAEKKNLHSVYELAIRNDVDAVMSDETCAVSKPVFDTWYTPWDKSYHQLTGNLKGNIYTNLLADIASFAPVCEKVDKKGETDKEDASADVEAEVEAETVAQSEKPVESQEDVSTTVESEGTEEAEVEYTPDVSPEPVMPAPESAPEPVCEPELASTAEPEEPATAETAPAEQEQGEEVRSTEPISDDAPAQEIAQESEESGQNRECITTVCFDDVTFIEPEPAPEGNDSVGNGEGEDTQAEPAEETLIPNPDISAQTDESKEGKCAPIAPTEDIPAPESDMPASADTSGEEKEQKQEGNDPAE